MITYTTDSYQIPSQNKTKSKFKNLPKLKNVWILKTTLHAIHLLELLDKMCKYEMDPTNIVEDAERAHFCPQTDRCMDGQIDRQMDMMKPVYPPPPF